MGFMIKFTSDALKDIPKIEQAGLKANVQKLLDILKNNPYQNPPPYEKLKGDLKGSYSRRINIQHRLVYQVFEEEKIVKITSMWTHYE